MQQNTYVLFVRTENFSMRLQIHLQSRFQSEASRLATLFTFWSIQEPKLIRNPNSCLEIIAWSLFILKIISGHSRKSKRRSTVPRIPNSHSETIFRSSPGCRNGCISRKHVIYSNFQIRNIRPREFLNKKSLVRIL